MASLEERPFGTRGALRLRPRTEKMAFGFGLQPRGRRPVLKRTAFAILKAALLPVPVFASPGAPGGTRTPDPQLRRLLLYPVELQAPEILFIILGGELSIKRARGCRGCFFLWAVIHRKPL